MYIETMQPFAYFYFPYGSMVAECKAITEDGNCYYLKLEIL